MRATLRVLALSLAGLAVAPGQAAAAWQKIDEVKDDITQPDSFTYVDPATVQRKGDLASASTLVEFKDGNKWRSYITTEEFDCRKKLVRTLKFTSYSERMAKGTAKEEKSNARWAPVHSEEHSASEPTFTFVCGKGQKAAASAAPVASASGNLSGQDVKAFGGLYSVKCGAARVPQLTVTADSVTMENGNKRLVARNLMTDRSYFGRSAPKNFEGALIGNLKPKASLTFLVYSDNAGRYITIEEDRKHARYRRCK